MLVAYKEGEGVFPHLKRGHFVKSLYRRALVNFTMAAP
jgi:hypothetical protein